MEPFPGRDEDPLIELSRLAGASSAERARKVLAVGAQTTDSALSSAVVTAVKAVKLARDGRYAEAVKEFKGIKSFISSIENLKYRYFLRSAQVTAQGSVLSEKGRAREALELLNDLADEVENLAISHAEVRPTAMLLRLSVIEVEMGQAVALSDVDGAQRLCARLESKAAEALNDAGDEPSVLSLAARSTLLRVAAFRWQLAMDGYDFRGALEQVHRTRPVETQLVADANELGNPYWKATVDLHVLLMQVAADLSKISADVLLDRRRPTRTRARTYDELRRKATWLEEAAQAAQQPGLVRQARITRMRVGSIEKADAIQGKDWGRYGGILSLIAFCAYILVVWNTMRPEGTSVVPALLFGLVIALIAGFGTTALVFLPMIKAAAQIPDGVDSSAKPQGA